MLTCPLLSLFVSEVCACECFRFGALGGFGFGWWLRCWAKESLMCITLLILRLGGGGGGFGVGSGGVGDVSSSGSAGEGAIDGDFDNAFVAVGNVAHTPSSDKPRRKESSR